MRVAKMSTTQDMPSLLPGNMKLACLGCAQHMDRHLATASCLLSEVCTDKVAKLDKSNKIKEADNLSESIDET